MTLFTRDAEGKFLPGPGDVQGIKTPAPDQANRDDDLKDGFYPLPKVVQGLHQLLYGNGESTEYVKLVVAVEIFGVIGYLIWVTSYACIDPLCKGFNIIIFVLQMLLIVFNTTFGYQLCRSRSLEKTINFAVKHSPLTIKKANLILERGALFSMAFFSIFSIVPFCLGVFLFAKSPSFPGGFVFQVLVFALFGPLYIIARAHAMLSSFHLALIWLYLNWLFYHTVEHTIQKGIIPANLWDNTVHFLGEKLVRLLRHMDTISNEWTMNHAIRYILSLILATVELGLVSVDFKRVSVGRRNKPTVLAIDVFFFLGSCLLYFSVFVTALATGYITDHFFDTAGAKLFQAAQWTPSTTSTHTEVDEEDRDNAMAFHGDLKMHKMISRSQGNNPSSSTSQIRRNAGRLLLEFEALYGRYGMRYAGIPLTLAGALTVGSIISVLSVNVSLMSVRYS